MRARSARWSSRVRLVTANDGPDAAAEDGGGSQDHAQDDSDDDDAREDDHGLP